MAVVPLVYSPPTGTGLPIALTDGANIATDATKGNVFYVTLAGNRTFTKPTGGRNLQVIVYAITQDATGSRTATWGAGFSATGDTSLPTLTTTADAVDFVAFIYSATKNKWYAHAVNKNAT